MPLLRLRRLLTLRSISTITLYAWKKLRPTFPVLTERVCWLFIIDCISLATHVGPSASSRDLKLRCLFFPTRHPGAHFFVETSFCEHFKPLLKPLDGALRSILRRLPILEGRNLEKFLCTGPNLLSSKQNVTRANCANDFLHARGIIVIVASNVVKYISAIKSRNLSRVGSKCKFQTCLRIALHSHNYANQVNNASLVRKNSPLPIYLK